MKIAAPSPRVTANKSLAISMGNNTQGLTSTATFFSGIMVAYVTGGHYHRQHCFRYTGDSGTRAMHD